MELLQKQQRASLTDVPQRGADLLQPRVPSSCLADAGCLISLHWVPEGICLGGPRGSVKADVEGVRPCSALGFNPNKRSMVHTTHQLGERQGIRQCKTESVHRISGTGMPSKHQDNRSPSEFPLRLITMRTRCCLCEDAGSVPGLAQWVKEPALLWLWHRLAAAAPMQPLVWELPYATRAATKRKKQNKKPGSPVGVDRWGQISHMVWGGPGRGTCPAMGSPWGHRTQAPDANQEAGT